VVTQQQPSSVTAGSPFGLTVEAENNSGNLISSFNGTVTVALASNPGDATLGGTLSVQASGGVATFSGLTINKTGSGYTLRVSSSGLSSAVSSAISVTKKAGAVIVSDKDVASPSDLLLAPLVPDSQDLFDGLGLKKYARSI